jgi:hypothetical protein
MSYNTQIMKTEIISALDVLPLESLELLFDFVALLRKRIKGQMEMEQYHSTMSWEQFQTEFQKTLEQSGYTNREDILELVQEVKREIADERLGKV